MGWYGSNEWHSAADVRRALPGEFGEALVAQAPGKRGVWCLLRLQKGGLCPAIVLIEPMGGRSWGYKVVDETMGPVEYDVPLAWLDRLILRNGATLEAVLRGHPAVRAVLFGHIHRPFDATLGAAPLLGTPATCYQFGPRSESREISTAPPAFRTVAIEDGQLATEVRWLDPIETTARG